MDAVDELNLLLGIGPAKAKLPITLTKSGYSAIKPLGKGGFGQAHLVYQQYSKKYYAVKHINLMQLSPRQRKDAHNEIHILQSLNHPNIIRYCEFCEEHPHLYIVMEFADGGDLAGHLDKLKKARQRLSEDQLVNLFAQISLAIKYLHDRRILHRDIKPGNVFLSKNHIVKLGDFGISTVLQSTSAMAKTMAGTPVSFSPELCEGKLYNNKSDIWSLGVLLYEMSTVGDLPFDGKDMKTLMKTIITKDAPHLPSKHYSKNLDDLFQWMLQKDPANRPDIVQVLKHPAIASRMASVTSQLEMYTSRPASAAQPPPGSLSSARSKSGGGSAAGGGGGYGLPNRVFASNAHNQTNLNSNNNQQYSNNNASSPSPNVAQAAANMNVPPRPIVTNNNVSPPQPPPRREQPQTMQDQLAAARVAAEKEKERMLEEYRKKKQQQELELLKQRQEQEEKHRQMQKQQEEAKKKREDNKNYDGHLYDNMQYVMLSDSPPAQQQTKNKNNAASAADNVAIIQDDGIRVHPQNVVESHQQQQQQQYFSPGPPEELLYNSASHLLSQRNHPSSAQRDDNDGDDPLAQVIDELRETALDENEMKKQAAAARLANQEEDEENQRKEKNNNQNNNNNNNTDVDVVIDVSSPSPDTKKEKPSSFFEDNPGSAVDLNALMEKQQKEAQQQQQNSKEEGGIVVPEQLRASSFSSSAAAQQKTTESSSSTSTSASSIIKTSCLCGQVKLSLNAQNVIGSFVSTDDFSVRSSGNSSGVEYFHLPEVLNLSQLSSSSSSSSTSTSSLKKFVFPQQPKDTSSIESYFCSDCGTRMCVFNLSVKVTGCCVPSGVVCLDDDVKKLKDFTFSP